MENFLSRLICCEITFCFANKDELQYRSALYDVIDADAAALKRCNNESPSGCSGGRGGRQQRVWNVEVFADPSFIRNCCQSSETRTCAKLAVCSGPEHCTAKSTPFAEILMQPFNLTQLANFCQSFDVERRNLNSFTC